jgi:hypothetical protein
LKKTFSILLLILFLFNVGGYYIVFWGLRYQSNEKLKSLLDAGSYSEEGTIELKIPMNMPYAIHPRGFERANGDFEFDGNFYQLVKQKVENDTLHVVLITDTHEKDLVDTMTDYANLSNDLGGHAQKAFNFLGKLLKEYNSGTTINVLEFSPGTTINISFCESCSMLISRAENIPSPPPKS